MRFATGIPPEYRLAQGNQGGSISCNLRPPTRMPSIMYPSSGFRFSLRSAASLALASAALAGCGEGTPQAPTSVIISVDMDGAGGRPATERRVDCPTTRDAAACRALMNLPDRVGADQACAMIYGGPETASVTGEVSGRRVDERFSRNNGCEIDRWRRAAALLAAPAPATPR